jgi:tetratricopeptide (TPR) repeat protein
MQLKIEQALQQGVTAHKEGKLQDAERAYQAILQSQPKHPDANHNLGLIAISVNQIEAALPLFKTALNVNPNIEQFWVSYIDALVKAKHLKDAKKAIKKAKKQGFDAKKLQVLLSQSKGTANTKVPSEEQLTSLLEHYQNGRFYDAEKLSVSITQEFPKHQFGWKVLGAVLKQTGRAIESLSAMKKSVQLAPQDVEAHSNLGVTLQELGRLDEAEASLTQAIALKPDYAEAHSNMGSTLNELGRLDEAEVSYRQAIVLKPDFAGAHNNLGFTLQELGRLDEAEASYTQAITLNPGYVDALRNRSLLLFNKKKFEAALRDADLCISKGAKELDLTTLYALGRIEEIYKRIEIQSEVDGENISIAAFASFIAEVAKKNTVYNFCPNPVDFIHVANLSSHVKNSVLYVAGVIEELNEIETIWEPSGKTTVSGFQSLRSINLFKNPSGKIAQLKSIIIDEIEAYNLKFHNELCSYIQKWPSGNNLFGWHVVLKHQGYQNAHIHTGGWLSGVIYLKVVPSLGKDEGAIEFSLNGPEYRDDDSPSLTFQPEVGDMVFFPSSLHHKTIPFMTDTDRIIISFDLIPEKQS